tara:strand:- start:1239 stop:2258 length:1020 start_codon:yes stop_codon:yes gene_type:complete
LKKNNILVLSFLISFFFSTATLLIIFIIEENIKNFFTLFFLTFTTYYITLYFSFKLFLSKTIKKLIDEFYSSEYNLSDQSNLDNLDSLSKSLKEYAKNKNLQIELLKDQDNYRKDFIGNISHELKTPLFTIQSYILTLIDGGMDDPDILKKYLKRSSKAIDRLTYLVKDLDLISQFESGVKSIEKEKFDILSIISNVYELLEMESKKNKISLELDKNYLNPIFVMADKDRIQQVITNLVMNSIKYGVENGTTEISIQDLNKEKFIISVTDNGLGISKEHLPRLFERFYRVDKSGNRKKGGSGLGLSIVKHVIEAHNEKIFVESNKNVGSEFSFTLEKVI